MALIESDSLQARFHALSETERQAICKELRSMVNTWRTLEQSKDFQYVGELFLLERIVGRLSLIR
jgi:hypothetical protein